MKVCLTLICLLFLTLQDGDAAGTRAGKEGENITVGFKFSFSGSPMYFCKENCEGENILIETKENTAQKGRYSIEWVKNDFMSYVFFVSISELKRSDSGWYRCALGSITYRYEDFYLDVTEASNSLEPNWTLETFTATFLSSTSVTTAATLTQRLISSSSTTIQQTTILSEPNGETFPLLYVGLGLAVLIVLLATVLLIYCQRKRFHQQKGLQLYVILTLIAKIILLSTPLVIFCWNSWAMKSKDLQLYVILTLIAKIILLSTPLVIFCWKWRSAMINKDSAVGTESDDVSQIDPELEEIKEDRQNNSPAEEISSVYS
ncbi:uncharacterized protein LOC111611634 [Xiphophorus maculatus]|uniref:uncharacterized protein LOC111611634 n=1 Tax=Xiphophorus maculatus TaxID=8083 RepID=UPI000C6D6E96|nr:uncharacterized protein LOC111611634 [Xiphophorus maculatus]